MSVKQETPRIPYRMSAEQLHVLSAAVGDHIELIPAGASRLLYTSINHEIGVAIARMELTKTDLITHAAHDNRIIVFFEEDEVEALKTLPLDTALLAVLCE